MSDFVYLIRKNRVSRVPVEYAEDYLSNGWDEFKTEQEAPVVRERERKSNRAVKAETTYSEDE